jgi:arginase
MASVALRAALLDSTAPFIRPRKGLSSSTAALRMGAERRARRAGLAFQPFLEDPPVVSILGCPVSLGQPLLGVDDGPSALRAASLVQRLGRLNWRVNDLGNLQFPTLPGSHPKARFAHTIGNANRVIAEKVSKEAAQRRFVLSLGGDHSIAIGTIAGVMQARPDVGIVWVDAHADINNVDTTLSGNVHGMSVSFLMKHKPPINGFEWMTSFPRLEEDRIVYVGLRDLDPAEREILKERKIRCFTMQQIDRYGIGEVMQRTVDHLKDRPLHLSLDVDVIDPFLAPSTGTTVHGGLTFREANYVCEAMAETGRLGSMDLVELNPHVGNDSDRQNTVTTAVDIICSALGQSIL